MSKPTEADTRRAIAEVAKDYQDQARRSGHEITYTEAHDRVREAREQGDRNRRERS